MTSPEDEQLRKDIRSAALSVHVEWGEVIEVDDLQQEMWVRLLEADYKRRLLDMDSPARKKTLRVIAEQICKNTRRDYMYYSGNFYYSTREVRKLLRDGELSPDWEGDIKSPRYDPDKVTNTKGQMDDYVCSVRDLNAAYAVLAREDSAYYATITNHYVHDINTRDASGGKKLTRAVDKLTRIMNRLHRTPRYEGPGTRKVVANHQVLEKE